MPWEQLPQQHVSSQGRLFLAQPYCYLAHSARCSALRWQEIKPTKNPACQIRPAKASALTVSTASFHFADYMKLSGLTGKTKLV
jgi:hypothetical protein